MTDPRITPAAPDLLAEIAAAARELAEAEDRAGDARGRRNQAVAAARRAGVPERDVMAASGLKRAMVTRIAGRD